MIAVEERRTVTAQSQRVTCQECSTTVATVQFGLLRIEARHHGERHVSLFSLRDLIRLLEESEAA